MNRVKEKNKEIIQKWIEENLDRRVLVYGDFDARTEKRKIYGIKKKKEKIEKAEIK